MRRILAGLCLLTVMTVLPRPALALNVERLDPADEQLLQSSLQHLEPLITAHKKDGTANILTWEEIYAPLSPEERAFWNALRQVKAETLGSTSHFFGEPAGADVVPVGQEFVTKNGERSLLDPQFLPQPVLSPYHTMMEAMAKDLGKRLLVESGFRSSAYQLYLFLYYMPKHGYSIRETNRHVALPGYSEHGNPARQAIDFINEAGINGEDKPEEFEALPEYAWLQQHAAEFGFHLSYPRNNASNTAFEPWHWHYEPISSQPISEPGATCPICAEKKASQNTAK